MPWFTRRRRNSRNSIHPYNENQLGRQDTLERPVVARQTEFLTRAQPREIEPRRNHDNDDIFSAEAEIPAQAISITRESSNESDYPTATTINSASTDIVSPLDTPVVEVVGQAGHDCCLPGIFSSNCRICPQTPRIAHQELIQSKNDNNNQNVINRVTGGKKTKRFFYSRRKKNYKKKRFCTRKNKKCKKRKN
jgi:hypothetical protein